MLTPDERRILADVLRAAAQAAGVDHQDLMGVQRCAAWRLAAMAYAASSFGFRPREIGPEVGRSSATVSGALRLMRSGQLAAELRAIDRAFQAIDRARPRPKVAPCPPGAERPDADLARLRRDWPEWRL